MKVLTKYISKEFIKLQIFCQIIFISLYLIIDFVYKIDNFLEANAASLDVIFPYFIYKVPSILVQVIPVATLISVIALFRIMKNNREIMALRACGINVNSLSQTVIIISLFISIFTFVFSETVVPYTSSKGNEILNIKVNKEDPGQFYGSDQIWLKSTETNAIYWIKHFDGTKKIMEGLTLHFFDNDFKLIRRIEAKRGTWTDGKWRLEDGIIQEIQEDGDYRPTAFDQRSGDLPETPETLAKRIDIKDTDEMSYSQLKEYAEMVKNDGYNNASYLVSMGVKTALPFLCLILTLLGVPIALELNTGGIPLAVAAGVGLSFLYMVIMGVSRSLGLSGILPPFLAAWTANLLFILAGIYLMMTVKQ
jgi:lipopolysaccharide export system permease protein